MRQPPIVVDELFLPPTVRTPQRLSSRRVLQGIIGLRVRDLQRRANLVRGGSRKRQGHGKRTRVTAERTNRMVTVEERESRRAVLAARDAADARRIKAVRRRLAERGEA